MLNEGSESISSKRSKQSDVVDLSNVKEEAVSLPKGNPPYGPDNVVVID